MNITEQILQEQITKIVKLCNKKIQEQKDHESSAGYGEDYTDGRIVGSAALARRIMSIVKGT
tara:strand:+ start:1983 stop:2168 length:186 start_codon:yes stop_codon:yes gene_type:complete